MSTMVLKEELSYYANNDASVFYFVLDASNAFDRVKYRQLFKLLVHRMLQPVSVLLLLNMCNSHFCRVSWNGVCTVPFSVLNGINLQRRQGNLQQKQNLRMVYRFLHRCAHEMNYNLPMFDNFVCINLQHHSSIYKFQQRR